MPNISVARPAINPDHQLFVMQRDITNTIAESNSKAITDIPKFGTETIFFSFMFKSAPSYKVKQMITGQIHNKLRFERIVGEL